MSMKQNPSANLPALKGVFLLYTASEGTVKAEVYFKDETVWLTQKVIVQLSGSDLLLSASI